MATYPQNFNFTHSGVSVDVELTGATGEYNTITFQDFVNHPGTDVQVQYLFGEFTPEKSSRKIIVRNLKRRWLDSNGEQIGNAEKLRDRTYNDEISTLTGRRYYSTFSELVSTKELRDMLDRALANETLENLEEFPQRPFCFNTFQDWDFSHPLDWSIVGTDESVADANDGNFTVTVVQPVSGSFEMQVLDSAGTPVALWTSTLTLNGLAPDTYTVYVRNVNDNNFTQFPQTVTIAAGA